MNQKHKTMLLIICFPAFILALIIAAKLRFNYLTLLMWVGTSDLSAVKLFSGVSNQWEMLKAITIHFTMLIFKGYFTGVLLTAASMFLLYFCAKTEIFCSFIEKTTSILDNYKAKLIWGGAALLILLMVFTFFYQLAGQAVSTDEFAYDFQSNLLKSFKLYAPSPEHFEYFQSENIVVSRDKWYNKYTIGFPLLLSLGRHLNMSWIVNPLLSLGTLWFLYQLSFLLFDKRTAKLSVMLAVLSPFFFYNGSAAFQPHMSIAFALLGAAYFYFLTIKSGSNLHAVFTAGLFSLGALIRPVDAALWAAAFVPLSLYFLIIKKERRSILISFITMLITGLAGLAFILLINKFQTGDFLLFSFHYYDAHETWGFGSYSHNVYRASWNTLYSLYRIVVWGPILFFELSVLSLFSKQKKNQIFLWFIFLLYVVFFFGWYALGHYEYGPRYLFTGFLFLIPAAASGIVLILDFLQKKGVPLKTAAFIFTLTMILSTLISVYPPLSHQISKKMDDNAWVRLSKETNKTHKELQKPIAVFVTNYPEYRVNNVIRNHYPLQNNKILYLLFLDPYKNLQLIKKYYPNFIPYIATYDPVSNSYSLNPYPDLKQAPASLISQYYTFAGLVHRFGLEDQKGAQECWLKAYEIDSNNIGSLINIAIMLLDEGHLKSSKEYLFKIKDINPDIPLIYNSLGIIAQYEGNYEEAVKYYQEYVKRTHNESSKSKTLERLYHFEAHGALPPLPTIEIKQE